MYLISTYYLTGLEKKLYVSVLNGHVIDNEPISRECHSKIIAALFQHQYKRISGKPWKYKMSHNITKWTKWAVRPANTQISLGIRPVWSESSLCAQWVAKDPRFLHANSEDWSDWADAKADLSLRWAQRSFSWFCHAAAQIWSYT